MVNENQTMYICGKCAFEVDREAKICPNCHANLSNIKCPYCGYVGEPERFRQDRCPRCGKSKNILMNYGNIKKHAAIQIRQDLPDEEKRKKEEGRFDFMNRFFPSLFIILFASAVFLLTYFFLHFGFSPF